MTARMGLSRSAFAPRLRAHGREHGAKGGEKMQIRYLLHGRGFGREGRQDCPPLRAHRLDIARKYGGRAMRPRAF